MQAGDFAMPEDTHTSRTGILTRKLVLFSHKNYDENVNKNRGDKVTKG
jgi:hypothetical protein